MSAYEIMLSESQERMLLVGKKGTEKKIAEIFNKWDLNQGFRMEHCIRGLEEEIPFIKECPKLFISAKTGRNVDKIFDMILEIKKNFERRLARESLDRSGFFGGQLAGPLLECKTGKVGLGPLRGQLMNQL